MKTLASVKVNPDQMYISLSKLIGKTVSDIHGYLSMETGEVCFLITSVRFSDGTGMGVEGEHDFPYLTDYGTTQPNFDQETLDRLYQERRAEIGQPK